MTFVVLVAAQQDVGKAGLADTGGALESGKRKSGSKFQFVRKSLASLVQRCRGTEAQLVELPSKVPVWCNSTD